VWAGGTSAQLRMKDAQLKSHAAGSPGAHGVLARIAEKEHRTTTTEPLAHGTPSSEADHHVRRLQSLLYAREKVPAPPPTPHHAAVQLSPDALSS
jgi:hypothetical protein